MFQGFQPYRAQLVVRGSLHVSGILQALFDQPKDVDLPYPLLRSFGIRAKYGSRRRSLQTVRGSQLLSNELQQPSPLLLELILHKA